MDERKNALLASLPQDASSEERLLFKNRIDELSEIERIQLEGALKMNRNITIPDLFSLFENLDQYEVLYGVTDLCGVGKYFADLSLPEKTSQYMDMEQYGQFQLDEALNYVRIGDGYVIEKETTGSMQPIVKLKLASAEQPEGTWLKFPYYDPGNGTLPARDAALDFLKVTSLDECTFMEASCVFPEIDLSLEEYCTLEDAASDIYDFCFELGDSSSKQSRRMAAALEVEGYATITDALEILGHFDQCKIVSEDAETYGREKAAELKILKPGSPEESFFDFREFGLDQMKANGLSETSYGVVSWPGLAAIKSSLTDSGIPQETAEEQEGGMCLKGL